MQQNEFTPDFTKRLVTIIIDIYENASTFGVTPHNGHKPTYPEILGAMESQKISLILRHGLRASKDWKEFTKREKAKHKANAKKKKRGTGKR